MLLAGFERLGAESRYQRFLAPMAELSEDGITYLTDIDHHDHEALAAIDAETGDGVGVARFIRRADRPDTAEAAVTVIDEWQGRGVGTALLDLLAERARAEGSRPLHRAAAGREPRHARACSKRLGPVHVVGRQTAARSRSRRSCRRPAPARDLHGLRSVSAARGEGEQLVAEARRPAPAGRARARRR